MKVNLQKSKTKKNGKRDSFQPLEGMRGEDEEEEKEKIDVFSRSTSVKNSSKLINGITKIATKTEFVDGSTQYIPSVTDQSISTKPTTTDVDVSTIKKSFHDYSQSTDVHECKDIDIMTDVVIMKEAEVSTIVKHLTDSSTMTPQSNGVDTAAASAIAQN
jgi:hypothetical protein